MTASYTKTKQELDSLLDLITSKFKEKGIFYTIDYHLEAPDGEVLSEEYSLVF
ncbi:hypothetical protein M23134_03894 [Microscilla marina ATCC 23134]|uniref:Uncharacterized protein n=1 Tax=Microscilla marina ATCC 23134 TaxID=313606 RepID=A1ZMG2_MICM2|nr:hypothetical protein M23134_03894 [Microscilla marina ATCC 23134]